MAPLETHGILEIRNTIPDSKELCLVSTANQRDPQCLKFDRT